MRLAAVESAVRVAERRGSACETERGRVPIGQVLFIAADVRIVQSRNFLALVKTRRHLRSDSAERKSRRQKKLSADVMRPMNARVRAQRACGIHKAEQARSGCARALEIESVVKPVSAAERLPEA